LEKKLKNSTSFKNDLDIDNIISNRKKDHLFISLNKDVSYKTIKTGFENYRFIHQALPELDLNKIDTSTTIFGKKINLPLMISPLVGGIVAGENINKKLARVAQELNIAMGVGSQRLVLEELDNGLTFKSFQIRDVAPDILLFSNIGAVQLNYGFTIKHCRKSIKMINADGLILHLNSMQEVFQPEGNYNFSNLQEKIKSICDNLEYPVIVREVGFGISSEAAEKLILANVSGIDVGGSGGTSWIEVEKQRAEFETLKNVAEIFKDWGIPTSESILAVKKTMDKLINFKKTNNKSKNNSVKNNKTSKFVLIASGGIRDGLDIAKALALGADLAGIALPILKKVNISIDACINYIKELELGLKIAMFGIGAKSIEELKNTKFLIKK